MPEALRRLRRRSVADVLAAWSDAAPPVTVATVPLSLAYGAVTAAPIHAVGPLPDAAVALIDGVAVRAIETLGASPYTPADVSAAPIVSAGDTVPAPFDALAPLTEIGVDAALAPGANLRRIGDDAAAGTVLLPAGRRLEARALAILAEAGVAKVAVRRVKLAVRTDRPDGPAARLIRHLSGAVCDVSPLAAPADAADIVVFVGGAAIGGSDAALAAADTAGWQPFGPVAAQPGATILVGTLQGRPTLVLPDRSDDRLAAALMLLRPLVSALAEAPDTAARKTLPLAGKLTSAVGVSELVLLAETADGAAWQPLAVGRAGLAALATATAWAVLPPESEGADAGAAFTATLFTDQS